MTLTVLQTLFYILVLYIAFFNKTRQRAIFWTIGSILALGTMLFVGLGMAHPKEPIDVWNIIFPVISGGTMIWLAEKQRDIIRKRQEQTKTKELAEETHEDKENLPKIELPAHLKTDLAIKMFETAVEEGLISWRDNKYKWTGTEVLLAYFCGRIYCGDTIAYNPQNKKYSWKRGKNGDFPDRELNEFFGKDNLGTSRNNRINSPAPKGYKKINEIYEAAL